MTVTDGVTLEQFRHDRLLRQAVERNFEIVGEAVRRLEKDDPGTAAAIADYRRIIAFRNWTVWDGFIRWSPCPYTNPTPRTPTSHRPRFGSTVNRSSSPMPNHRPSVAAY